MNKKMNRREAMRWMAMSALAAVAACTSKPAPTQQPTAAAAATAVPSQEASQAATQPSEATSVPQPTEPTNGQAYLSVVHGPDPATLTETAMRALGGMERFVKSGFDVIIKPNICTDYYSYEYGATTNPVVVATLVKLAFGAGAKRVRVMDSPFGGTAASAYVKSGIAEAVEAAGGEMEVMNPNKFQMTAIPDGKSLHETEIFQDVLKCDLLIDVPIAKHHNMAGITVGSKNLMGVIRNRGAIHANMKERIPDLVSVIRPGLTVVDAIRTLLKHGPTGGNLDDVMLNNTVIASHDIVAADAYAAQFFGLSGKDVPYINNAAERGLGSLDLASLKIEELSL